MIEISDGDRTILKAALEDAIRFQRSMEGSKVKIRTGDQSEEYMNAVITAEMYKKILTKLNRRMHVRRKR